MSEDSVTRRRPGATRRARQLRRDETDAEYKVWYRLRGREIGGFKFVRQLPLGPYVVDFLCRSERLVVELDGEQHAENVQDLRRTAWLNGQGYSVLRFWNDEALQEREAVLDCIHATLTRKIVGPGLGLRFSLAGFLSPRGEAESERSSEPGEGKNVERRRARPSPCPLPGGERMESGPAEEGASEGQAAVERVLNPAKEASGGG